MHVVDGSPIVLLPGFTRLGLNMDIGTIGQEFHRRQKIEPLVFHDEVDDIATCPATEAVIDLFVRTDTKRRCFLIVKGTSSKKITTRAFELDIIRDDIDDIVGFTDLFYSMFWYEGHNWTKIILLTCFTI